MARDIRAFSITVPAGTLPAQPLVTKTPLGVFQVAGIEVVTPEGVRGSVGIRFTSSGQPMIPSNDGGWIIPHPGLSDWSLTGQITSGAWELTAYNTGQYPHTLNVRYLLDLIAPAAAPTMVPILSAADIMGATADLVAGSVAEVTE